MVLKDKVQAGHTVAYVSLGANMGDVPETFSRVRKVLGKTAGVEIDAASPLYRTEPQGFREQPFFYNQVLRLLCGREIEEGFEREKVSPCPAQEEILLGAQRLLTLVAAMEDAFGRVRTAENRNAPRPLDMDILLYGDVRVNLPDLVIPHPRMLERAFVLAPLADISPNMLLPQGMTVRQALDALSWRLEGDVILQP